MVAKELQSILRVQCRHRLFTQVPRPAVIPPGAFSISASGPRHLQGSLGCGCLLVILLGIGRTDRSCEWASDFVLWAVTSEPNVENSEEAEPSSTCSNRLKVAQFKGGMYDQHHPTFHTVLNRTYKSRLPDHGPFIL